MRRACLCAILLLGFASAVQAQSTGSLRGEVLDPSGAAVPGAKITLGRDSSIYSTHSNGQGAYVFSAVSAGSYTLTVEAPQFALFSQAGVAITTEQAQRLNIKLTIAVQQQGVTVTGDGVSINPDENASSTVIKGTDLDALSDDPDQLQSELQALAGSSAGPDGGQMYIDGFTGGQLPPKSSIREIRVNQNPFSAEFDRLGYGRIEILTKPGSDKRQGQIAEQGIDSALDTNNPLVQDQPPYYSNYTWGNFQGPLFKRASYFLDGGYYTRQTQNIVNAVDPANTAARVNESIQNPIHGDWADARIDLQLGKSNTFTARESFYSFSARNSTVGGLSLPAQGINRTFSELDIQLGDTIVVNPHLLNETRFQWRRVRVIQVSQNTTPTVTVEGAFNNGGNNLGVLSDHQDVFELQNNSTATAGKHTLRFGTHVRVYRDANYSTAGKNGMYIFNSLANYSTNTPDQYQVTVIQQPLARSLQYDGALFYQDDWRWKPNLLLSYGLRFETQDVIRDHADWAPRFSLAWAPMHHGQTAKPKTVLRAGYGWFYNRFNVNSGFNSAGSGGVPYLTQVIHQNGVNQQNFVVNDPGTLCYTSQSTCLSGASSSRPVIYSIDPHLHAALNMQSGLGIDRQFGKHLTTNATYLYTRGIHQFLTNNISAPAFDPATYTITGAPPATYNYQYQSGGVYSEHQIVVSASVHSKRVSLNGNYTFSTASSDTQGAGSFPSVAADPGLDYGRASFGIHNKISMIGSYSAPHGIIIAPILDAQSGTPYNITIGNDLTGNNQFNARPTYGTCGAADVVSTNFGCLDANPTGKGEKIVPYNLGTGPANVAFHLRVSKVIGIGPRIKSAAKPAGDQGDLGSGGLGGGQAQIKLDATAPRRYSLTLAAAAINLFNVVNRSTPNGVLNSPIFGQSQTLAGGAYWTPVPGNRVVYLNAMFSF